MGDSEKARPKIGVALSGGAAHGFAHIGVLKVLHEARIPIDFLMGTSIGSFIGAAYASGSSFEEMLEVCSSLRWRDIAKLTLSKRGLASIDRSDRVLDRLIRVDKFEDLKTRLYVVTTDIRSGEIIILSRGDLKRAVKASCSIPGLFVPVEIQGRSLVDGGVSANLPVLPLRQLGAQKIIAVDVTARIDSNKSPENLFQIMVQSMFIVGHAAMRVARERADVLVEPKVNQYPWDDFVHCEEIVRAGEHSMLSAMDRVSAWVPGQKRTFFQRLRSALHLSADA